MILRAWGKRRNDGRFLVKIWEGLRYISRLVFSLHVECCLGLFFVGRPGIRYWLANYLISC